MQSLILHICCGPCATTVIDRLHETYDITGYFYNPNIHPEDEYWRRLEAVRTVADRLNIPLLEGPYDTVTFFSAVRGLEDEPENGARCPVCYRLRLSNTARVTKRKSFDRMASTLTVGPMKKADVINPIGKEEAKRAGVSWFSGDWKKNGGFKQSCEMSKELKLYRQQYCGCVYSMR